MWALSTCGEPFESLEKNPHPKKSYHPFPVARLSLNPNNKDHFIYTKPPMTYQSMDGGKSYESLNHSGIFHSGIDRQGNLYTVLYYSAVQEGFILLVSCLSMFHDIIQTVQGGTPPFRFCFALLSCLSVFHDVIQTVQERRHATVRAGIQRS